ncbi:hypothetical protein [Halosolutus halophilus]|uniref:hypothetical protein n=1 Tax=Halosolutus halophilus TaxID=1552990 RepID=UPI002234F91F|nr:hypothetical protein [Halosolutus halophilus]
MTNDVFTAPETTADEWVDVRMTEPEHGEWDVDVVVAGGRVEYVDLRIKHELLGGFVDCLLDDVDEDRAASILRTAASRRGIDLDAGPTAE